MCEYRGDNFVINCVKNDFQKFSAVPRTIDDSSIRAMT